MNGGGGLREKRKRNKERAQGKNGANVRPAVPVKKSRKTTGSFGKQTKGLLNEYDSLLEMKYGIEQKIARLIGGSAGLVSLLDCMQAEARMGNCGKFAFYATSFLRKSVQLESIAVEKYIESMESYLRKVKRYLISAERQLKAMEQNKEKEKLEKQYDVLLHADRCLMVSDELLKLYHLLLYAAQKLREGDLMGQEEKTADVLEAWSAAVDKAARAKTWKHGGKQDV